MKKIVLFLLLLITIAVCYGAGFNTNAPSPITYPVNSGKYSITLNSNNWNTYTNSWAQGFSITSYSNNIGFISNSGSLGINFGSSNWAFSSPGVIGTFVSFTYSNSNPNYSAYLLITDGNGALYSGSTNTLNTSGIWTNTSFVAYNNQFAPTNFFSVIILSNNTSSSASSLKVSNVQAGYYFPGTFVTNAPSTNTIN